ncbi:MAG: protease complex subunit PrcB family protein [Polaribacter sp.]|nr:protease complex subunit PrcB family protein [Polaribacter sp.]
MKTIILIFSIFLVTSCDNSQFQSTEITPVLISKGEMFNGNYNPTKHNKIFDNSTEWNYFITDVWAIATIPNEAIVNFDQHIVIATFDKPRSTGGHSIDIISITENSNNIVVIVEKLNNGDLTQIPTRPYHFVKIPKTTKEIVFE